ncbi:MAG: hypothetical protein U0U70_10590 [Chitinophagaceae bacterium]
MKRILISAGLALALISCGKSKSGTEMGQEVCDCSKKANGMDAADPKRSAEQEKCTKLQTDYWEKIKDNQKKADEFNAVLRKCAEEQIKKSFGQ